MARLMPFCCPKYIHINRPFPGSRVGHLGIRCSTICRPFSFSWCLPISLLAFVLLVGTDQSLCVTCHAHAPGPSLASTVPVLCFTQNSLFSCSEAVNLHYIIALWFHLSEQNLRSQVILLNESGIEKIGAAFH